MLMRCCSPPEKVAGATLQSRIGMRRRSNSCSAAWRATSAAARSQLEMASAGDLFPTSRAPEAALAGLYFYFSCWDDAHRVAQDISTAEGSYWHAIVHRQEPDDWNSAYWFRQVGRHPHKTRLWVVRQAVSEHQSCNRRCSRPCLRPHPMHRHQVRMLAISRVSGRPRRHSRRRKTCST